MGITSQHGRTIFRSPSDGLLNYNLKDNCDIIYKFTAGISFVGLSAPEHAKIVLLIISNHTY